MGKQDKNTLDPPDLEGAISALKRLVHILSLWVSVGAAETILTR